MKCLIRTCGYNLDTECSKRPDNVQPSSVECPHYLFMFPAVAVARPRLGIRERG